MYKFANNTQNPDKPSSIYAEDPNDNNEVITGMDIKYMIKVPKENRKTLMNVDLGMLLL